MKKKILFISYGAGHFSMIDLIARFILNNDIFEVLIIPLNAAIPIAKKKYSEKNIYTLSKFSNLFNDEINDIFKYGNLLLEENFNPQLGISKIESIFYLGLSLLDLVRDYGEDAAFKIYSSKKRQAFLPVNVMTKILNHINPNLVFTTNSPRFEVASLIASKRLGISSVQILDLFGDDYPVPSADHIIVMNDSVKVNLRNRGVNSSTIHAFGQPILEETASQIKNINSIDLKISLGLGSNVLLFCPHKNIEFNEDGSVSRVCDSKDVNEKIFEVLNEISKLLNLDVIIRPHPSDNIDDYSKYLKMNQRFHYFPQQSVFQAIAISDYALSYCSTVVLQALVSGKVGFTFNQRPDLKYPWLGYSKEPFVYSSNYSDLKNNLIKYVNDCGEGKNDSIFEFGSLDRISNLIKKIII